MISTSPLQEIINPDPATQKEIEDFYRQKREQVCDSYMGWIKWRLSIITLKLRNVLR